MSSRKWWLGLLLLAGPLLGAVGPVSSLERGRLLFVGELPVVARMVGHEQPLPAYATRCGNCHTQPALRTVGAQADFAPLLSRATLTEHTPRRGGPPSAYDAKALCRLLSEGVDPAHVMISQAMPRYTFSPSDCEALWTFLTLP